MRTAAEFIAGFEGFAQRAYWDVNAFRLGYGSDTEGPDQIPVTQGMTTTKERALQNLALRIPQFQHEAINGKTGMGSATWDRLNDNQKSAVLSLVYNYGRLPKRVVVIPGDPERTAASIRALQTDNAGVNHKRRNAEADFYLAASAPPQRAPTAPIPQVPVPRAPVPPVLPPMTAPGLPPISSSAAGRRAAFRDGLGSYCDVLEGERAAFNAEIDAEIAAIRKMITEDFGKPDATDAPPPLQIPAAEPVAQPTKRIQKMFGPNWQTSLSGIGALLGAAAGIAHSVSEGKMPDTTELGVIFAAVSAGVGLLQAKDKAVTGGTVPATSEAKRRVGA